jgi:serine protease DegQ
LPGTPSRLGATVQELTPELAAYFGAKDGVLVAAVAANSPASQADLRAGDVITAIDGRAVGSRADLTREIREAARDGSVTLGIVRDKKGSSLDAKMPAPPDRRPLRPGRTL